MPSYRGKYSITVEPAAVAAAGAAAATALMQPGLSVSPANLPPELLQAWGPGGLVHETVHKAVQRLPQISQE